MCVKRVSAMCTAGMPHSRSVALEGRLVGCLYTMGVRIRVEIGCRTGPPGYSPGIGSEESILGLLKSLKIRALVITVT
jgi:hypothetical protein